MTGLPTPKLNSTATPERSLWTILREVVTFTCQFVAVIAACVFGAWAIKSYDVQLRANDLASQSLQYSVTGNQYVMQALQTADASNRNSNQLAMLSGQLSLLAYCQAYGNSTNNQPICDAIAAALPPTNLASALSIPLPSPKPTLPSSGIPLATATASGPIISNALTTSSSSSISSTAAPFTGSSASSASSGSLSLGAIIGNVAASAGVAVALIAACIQQWIQEERMVLRSSA
ncbi:hypothetical protein MMC34_004644 [Xylographa carneopallida]|nr:hypothetical protein [Xylographa carneopallida]